MRQWLLAHLRRGRGSSSSRRAMLSDGAQRPGEVAAADTDEEKGGAGPRASKGERPVVEERKEAPQRTTPSTSGGEEDEEMAPPAPVRLPRFDSSDRHSFAESMHSVLTSMHHHKLPKWQYRLLVSSVVVLLLVLVLLLVVSLLYGFGLQFPQVSVLTTESLAPGLMDATATPAEQGDGDGDEQMSVADCHGRFV